MGAGSAAGSETVHCGNRLVSTGDTKAEVLITCGEPAWRMTGQIHHQRRRLAAGTAHHRGPRALVSNVGPNAFLEFLSFDNGRVNNF